MQDYIWHFMGCIYCLLRFNEITTENISENTSAQAIAGQSSFSGRDIFILWGGCKPVRTEFHMGLLKGASQCIIGMVTD